MDLAEQLRWTQTGLALAFCAVLILVCGWLAEEKVGGVLNGRRKADDPTCPLHKTARSQCDRYHKEE